MSGNTVTNWFGDVVSHPRVIVDANSVGDIVAVLKDPVKYPSPVRAVGSNHSTSECGTAEGGTLIRMKMNRILHIGADTLTVEAGATHLTMAKQLDAAGKQFYVNTEIGSLTAGSAAIAGTKDASMPGEAGHVGSYVIGLKMVRPDGSLMEVTEDNDPVLMQKLRSSYGTFGIVYEVTYRIRDVLPLSVHHKTFELQDFIARLPELKALNYSMMFYMFPFANKITVEFRKYNPGAKGKPNRAAWAIRNHIWGTSGPKLGYDVEQKFDEPTVRYGIVDSFNAAWRFQLENIVVGDNTIPCDQIIDYPPVSNDSRYTFTFWAFDEADYPRILVEFYQYVNDYYRRTGYRSNLLYVGYRVLQDRKALLSYSWDADMMTIDPVSTGNKGWDEFLADYNRFSSDRAGKPLLNQTFGLNAAMVNKAYAGRWSALGEARKTFDPGDRLLNDYFRQLLAEGATTAPGSV